MSARTVYHADHVEVVIDVDTSRLKAAFERLTATLQSVAESMAKLVDAIRPTLTPLLVDTASRFAVESCGVAESDVWRVDPVAGVVKLRNWRRIDLCEFGWPDVPVKPFDRIDRTLTAGELLPLCTKGWHS